MMIFRIETKKQKIKHQMDELKKLAHRASRIRLLLESQKQQVLSSYTKIEAKSTRQFTENILRLSVLINKISNHDAQLQKEVRTGTTELKEFLKSILGEYVEFYCNRIPLKRVSVTKSQAVTPKEIRKAEELIRSLKRFVRRVCENAEIQCESRHMNEFTEKLNAAKSECERRFYKRLSDRHTGSRDEVVARWKEIGVQLRDIRSEYEGKHLSKEDSVGAYFDYKSEDAITGLRAKRAATVRYYDKMEKNPRGFAEETYCLEPLARMLDLNEVEQLKRRIDTYAKELSKTGLITKREKEAIIKGEDIQLRKSIPETATPVIEDLKGCVRIINDCKYRLKLKRRKEKEYPQIFVSHLTRVEKDNSHKKLYPFKEILRDGMLSSDSYLEEHKGEYHAGSPQGEVTSVHYISFSEFVETQYGSVGFFFPVTFLLERYDFCEKLSTQGETGSGGLRHYSEFVIYAKNQKHTQLSIEQSTVFCPKEEKINSQIIDMRHYIKGILDELSKERESWFHGKSSEDWIEKHCMFYNKSEAGRIIERLKQRTTLFGRYLIRKTAHLDIPQQTKGHLRIVGTRCEELPLFDMRGERFLGKETFIFHVFDWKSGERLKKALFVEHAKSYHSVIQRVFKSEMELLDDIKSPSGFGTIKKARWRGRDWFVFNRDKDDKRMSRVIAYALYKELGLNAPEMIAVINDHTHAFESVAFEANHVPENDSDAERIVVQWLNGMKGMRDMYFETAILGTTSDLDTISVRYKSFRLREINDLIYSYKKTSSELEIIGRIKKLTIGSLRKIVREMQMFHEENERRFLRVLVSRKNIVEQIPEIHSLNEHFKTAKYPYNASGIQDLLNSGQDVVTKINSLNGWGFSTIEIRLLHKLNDLKDKEF